MNTVQYLLENAKDDKTALITPKGEFSYAQLKDATAALQARFVEMGAQPGDRIGIWASNSLFWTAAYLAALGLGAIAVPFATTLTSQDFNINNSLVDCSILCIDERIYKKQAAEIPAETRLVREPEVDLVNSQNAELDLLDLEDACNAAYMFTSGTTAYPRVVRITHRNIQANSDSIIQSLGLTRDERMMVVLPFYYCFGTSLLHTHLRVGGTLVMTGTLVFPETILDQIEQKGCTGIAGVPTIYQTFLRNTSFARRELPSLRKIQQAGGKLSNVLIRELVECRPGSEIYIMYGQTEATARLSCLPAGELKEKLGSIGKGLPGVNLSIVNELGLPVTPGETGEIIARGENISPGYLNEPEANAEKFIEGTLHTGDLATVDEDGYIYIVDRKSDFIKSYGNRVSSQQVEATALELTEIVSASAVGTPDEARGEAIILFVVLKSGSTLTPEDIILHFKTHAAAHMVPKEVRAIKAMPVNAHGKIVKAELKKLIKL